MTSFSSYHLVEELLSALRRQPVFAEVKGPGFFSGVEHQGLLVGLPEAGDTVIPRVFVEVSNRPVVDRAVANELTRKLSVLRTDVDQYYTKVLLLGAGSTTKAARQVLDEEDVAVRTLRSLDDLKARFWETLLPDYVDPGLSDTAQELIDALLVVPEGAQLWSLYEGVCRAFLTYLFVPDLGEPVSQSSTLDKSQRRDLIMKNQAQNGFWAWMRERYKADYLIAEIKNNKGLVGNNSVWQLAGYMKEKGVGFFGMLIARNGISRGTANPAIIDQWVHSNKMIVPISNEDLVSMVRLRDNGGDPTDFLGNLIDRVRCQV